MPTSQTSQAIKLSERNHVEKPLLDQLAGLGGEIIDLEMKQQPAQSFRDSFTEVVMLSVLRGQLKIINLGLGTTRHWAIVSACRCPICKNRACCWNEIVRRWI